MICMKKKFKKKFNNKDDKFKIFTRHIVLIKTFINDLMINHCNFYILNSKIIHHCSNNKTLFKNLRAIHKMIKIINDEVLNIKVINNIKIFFSNNKFLIFLKIMYIFILIINLIIISRF